MRGEQQQESIVFRGHPLGTCDAKNTNSGSGVFANVCVHWGWMGKFAPTGINVAFVGSALSQETLSSGTVNTEKSGKVLCS